MIELSETLVFAIIALVALVIALVVIAIVAIPQYFKHANKMARIEAEAERKAARVEAERQRLDSFNEIIHKAQLGDIARDCIAGKETAWVDTPTGDKKPSA